MRRYSPQYYSPPRRGYGGRPRSPPQRRYGGDRGRHKEQNHGSLLVRNIPLDCRQEELRVPFERFGVVRDVYLPKDYYTGEPRGFAFVQFVDPYDALEAQYQMNGRIFAGREITVVVAAETRKRPEEMRRKTRIREPSGHGGRRSSYYGGSRSRSRSYSPHYPAGSRSRYRSRSYSPALRRRNDYSASPHRRYPDRPRSPRDHPQEQGIEHNRRPYLHSYDKIDDQNADGYRKRIEHHGEEAHVHWRSPPGRESRSPSGSRSSSVDISPRDR